MSSSKRHPVLRRLAPVSWGVIGIGAFVGMYFGVPLVAPMVYDAGGVQHAAAVIGESALPVVMHLKTPEPVRGIYMSQCVVGTPSLRESLVDLVKQTELNTIIIDIKDYSGTISFKTGNPLFAGAEITMCGARDMKEFIETLHREGIYVVGRITVFQDPYYTSLHPDMAVRRASDHEAVWKDHKGLAFVDVGAKPFWDYIIVLAKESYAIGFDELNFDYVRYPSDGNMADAYYAHSGGEIKAVMLEKFFSYLSSSLKSADAKDIPVLSADLFGMTTTNEDDLNIGQVLERALPYFDYIAPMVYPSHYPKGFNGYANVNAHSYDIVHYALERAVMRTTATSTRVAILGATPIASTTPQLYEKPSYAASKIRPWLQSFDYPVTYTPEMVEAQIRAAEDAGLTSYLMWDAANKYRSLRELLFSPTVSDE